MQPFLTFAHVGGAKEPSHALRQVTEESRDNVKFLTTLERHFKNITNAPLANILDTLPPTMNALRMVWIISRYYSDDMRMGNLFKRIGQEIGDRVESAIDIKVTTPTFGRLLQLYPSGFDSHSCS